MVVVVESTSTESGAADERIGPVAVELIGVMPLTTAARGSEKICCWRDFAGTLPVGSRSENSGGANALSGFAYRARPPK